MNQGIEIHEDNFDGLNLLKNLDLNIFEESASFEESNK